jgi:hypothetical protein
LCSISSKGGRGLGEESEDTQEGKSPLTYKGAFVGVGGKFDGGVGGKAAGSRKDILPEQSFQLSSNAMDSA